MYEENEEDNKKGSIFKVIEFMGMDNIADELEKDELDKIGMQVIEDFEEDDDSREEWLKQNEDAIDLARQVREGKSFPWVNASNVKFPLVGQAAMQFNARAYPEVIQGDKCCTR